jgi:hypothetical protein
MILEYFSLGKGPFTGPWGRLEKYLPFYFRTMTSYLKMSGMPWIYSMYMMLILLIFEKKF